MSQDWIPTERQLPPDDVVVDAMDKQSKFPFIAYVLTAGMQVKQVEIIRERWGDWVASSTGSSHCWSDLHLTPQEAIAAGRARLDEQRAKLAKQQANIEKRAANLDKAAAKL